MMLVELDLGGEKPISDVAGKRSAARDRERFAFTLLFTLDVRRVFNRLTAKEVDKKKPVNSMQGMALLQINWRLGARDFLCACARLHATVGLGNFHRLNFDGGGAIFFQPKLIRGIGRHIDDSTLDVRAAIPDFDHLAVAVLQIRDPRRGAKR